MTTKTGTFLVTAADEDSLVLSDVTDGQVHTLEENPGLATGQAVEAALASVPPMDVVWTIEDRFETYDIAVRESDERPTAATRDLAAEMGDGDLETRERAGTGAIHVIAVPEEITAEAVADVLEDEQTLRTAASLGVERVEVRSEPGVVAVRYLP